jgi:hypothetical protein
MAGFRMHVTTSTVLGCGYAGALYAALDVPADSAVVAGAMCGFAGILPDLDSDYGVPLRETMAFTAAVAPMLLVGHFQTLSLTHDQMVLAAVSLYLLVRFGITKLIRQYTVHRGMFHSIPAALIFTGLAFLVCGTSSYDVRCFKAGGVFGGFMSHLILDEIYAVEWKGGRWRFKKSFGTALKFWGDNGWANFSTYAKLLIVAAVVLGEPSVVKRLQEHNPEFARAYQEWQVRIGAAGAWPDAARDAFDSAADRYLGSGGRPAENDNTTPANPVPPSPYPTTPWPPTIYGDRNDTARRPGGPRN